MSFWLANCIATTCEPWAIPPQYLPQNHTGLTYYIILIGVTVTMITVARQVTFILAPFGRHYNCPMVKKKCPLLSSLMRNSMRCNLNLNVMKMFLLFVLMTSYSNLPNRSLSVIKYHRILPRVFQNLCLVC